jgi:hypothetical protein
MHEGTTLGEVFMLSVATWATALAITIGAGARPLTADAVLESPGRHVRATDRMVRSMLRIGFEQSPTFAALMRRLELSDLTVYIEEVDRLPGALEGRLVLLPSAHGFRYVRIQVARRGTRSDMIALIGHELRHAVEVAEALEVTSERQLAALYRRIGISQGPDVYDTHEARETGRRVLKELA